MRFGPLNPLGGERRLNVAVTRSRSAMSVISSLKSHDIDSSRTKAFGPRLLRAYLDFAERGISALGTEVSQINEHDYDSPFEKEVAEALTRRGLAVRRQVGCSGFRIDLALVDPKRPGRFLLGIECDGATYHGSATARDCDRLRQEVLESLGWSIVRIWSHGLGQESRRPDRAGRRRPGTSPQSSPAVFSDSIPIGAEGTTRGRSTRENHPGHQERRRSGEHVPIRQDR